jgi:hypothetical protein
MDNSAPSLTHPMALINRGQPVQLNRATSLKANPVEVKEQYERRLKDLQEAYGEAMLELRARKKLSSLLGEEDEK